MRSFQTKSQENFAILTVFKCPDCWYATDRIRKEALYENMDIWDFIRLPVG